MTENDFELFYFILMNIENIVETSSPHVFGQ